jgi:hypothetical protein
VAVFFLANGSWLVAFCAWSAKKSYSKDEGEVDDKAYAQNAQTLPVIPHLMEISSLASSTVMA